MRSGQMRSPLAAGAEPRRSRARRSRRSCIEAGAERSVPGNGMEKRVPSSLGNAKALWGIRSDVCRLLQGYLERLDVVVGGQASGEVHQEPESELFKPMFLERPPAAAATAEPNGEEVRAGSRQAAKKAAAQQPAAAGREGGKPSAAEAAESCLITDVSVHQAQVAAGAATGSTGNAAAPKASKKTAAVGRSVQQAGLRASKPHAHDQKAKLGSEINLASASTGVGAGIGCDGGSVAEDGLVLPSGGAKRKESQVGAAAGRKKAKGATEEAGRCGKTAAAQQAAATASHGVAEAPTPSNLPSASRNLAGVKRPREATAASKEEGREDDRSKMAKLEGAMQVRGRLRQDPGKLLSRRPDYCFSRPICSCGTPCG